MNKVLGSQHGCQGPAHTTAFFLPALSSPCSAGPTPQGLLVLLITKATITKDILRGRKRAQESWTVATGSMFLLNRAGGRRLARGRGPGMDTSCGPILRTGSQAQHQASWLISVYSQRPPCHWMPIMEAEIRARAFTGQRSWAREACALSLGSEICQMLIQTQAWDSWGNFY